uniref:Uncharacterized protein n=1 Tax=Arundo donax TaxID=35708 RepID=A0A0A8XTP3_ARUDO
MRRPQGPLSRKDPVRATTASSRAHLAGDVDPPPANTAPPASLSLLIMRVEYIVGE